MGNELTFADVAEGVRAAIAAYTLALDDGRTDDVIATFCSDGTVDRSGADGVMFVVSRRRMNLLHDPLGGIAPRGHPAEGKVARGAIRIGIVSEREKRVIDSPITELGFAGLGV